MPVISSGAVRHSFFGATTNSSSATLPVERASWRRDAGPPARPCICCHGGHLGSNLILRVSTKFAQPSQALCQRPPPHEYVQVGIYVQG
jgi:hypothetical protein